MSLDELSHVQGGSLLLVHWLPPEWGQRPISNIIFDNGEISKVTNEKVGGYFSGTGDVFSAVLTGSLLNGKSLVEACKCAGEFITNTIKVTDVSDGNDGIAFEKTIGELISYE